MGGGAFWKGKKALRYHRCEVKTDFQETANPGLTLKLRFLEC